MEIIYYYPFEKDSDKVLGEFGIRIPEWDLTFYKMKLIRTLNGTLFIASPSYKFKNKEEKEEYRPYWDFSKNTKARFQEKALVALKEFYEKKYGKKLEDRQ